MRYFIANGYRPSPHPPQSRGDSYTTVSFGGTGESSRKQMIRRYREAGVPLPPLGEKVFLRVPQRGRLSVFVFGPYEAVVLIAAKSQRNAYLIGNAFRAVVTCFQGLSPVNNYDYYLLELVAEPTPNMSRRDLAVAIAERENAERGPDISLEMSGTVLDHVQIASACEIARQAIRKPVILNALLHLEYSRQLVWGFMVGSYYECHYARDRVRLSHYELERRYLEDRFRYDSAFVSAFRGIECVLGKPHFRQPEIQGLLVEADQKYGTLFASGRHRSWHEVFSTKRKWWTYDDLLAYYLKLRNAVSAHGNPSPPHIVMEDQVFEIQHLLQSMIVDILVPDENRVTTEPTPA